IRIEYAKWLSDGEVRLRFPGDPNRVPMDSAWSLELARTEFETILDQSPPGADAVKIAQGYIGEILMKLGDFDASKKRLEYVLATFDLGKASSARALEKIGHDQLRLGDAKGALATFRKAYETDPQLAYLWDVMNAAGALGGYPADLPASMRFPMRKEA